MRVQINKQLEIHNEENEEHWTDRHGNSYFSGHWTDMGILTLVGTGQTWEFLL